MVNNPEKILLVNPVTKTKERVLRVERCQQKVLAPVGIWPPVVLLEIATYLQYNGFKNIEIVDGEIEGLSFGSLVSEIAKKLPRMLVIQSTTPTIDDDILFSSMIKEKSKNTIIVFIGLHPTIFPEELLKNKSIDYVICGEPEETVSNLANLFFNKQGDARGIRSLGYRSNDDIFVNKKSWQRDSYDYPVMPDRSLLKNQKYIMPLTGKPFAVIKVSRGCDFTCPFCTSKAYYGRGFRSRSPENIIEEIKDVKGKLGINTFLFLSDTFNCRKDFVDRLSSLIIENNLKIRWVSNSRVDLVCDDTVKLMKEAGCMLVSLGIESYEENILKENKKYLHKENIDAGIEIFKKYGIITYGYFIFGLEKENKKSMLKTMLRASGSNLDFAHFYSLTPFPGTEYFNRYKSLNWKDYFHGISNIVEYRHLSRRAIKLGVYLAFIIFYANPGRLLRLVKYFLRRKLC